MKRVVGVLLAVLLALGGTAVAQGRSIVTQVVDGQLCFTPESYPEVWLTAYQTDRIVEGKKNSPPLFIHFLPLPGMVPRNFSPNVAYFTDFENEISYLYTLHRHETFNTFVKGIKSSNVIASGKDNVSAMYFGTDSHRVFGLIHLPGDDYEETSKLEINITDHTETRTRAELEKLIRAEVERLQAEMTFVRLDAFWSEKNIESAQLRIYEEPVMVNIRTTGLIVEKMDGSTSLRCKARTADGSAKTILFRLDPYSHAHYNADKARDYTMPDGTVIKAYSEGERTFAGIPVLETARYGGGPLYLTIDMQSSQEALATNLAELYACIEIEAL